MAVKQISEEDLERLKTGVRLLTYWLINTILAGMNQMDTGDRAVDSGNELLDFVNRELGRKSEGQESE